MMKSFWAVLVLVGFLGLSACSGEQRYNTLGYISFVGKPIEKVLVMREQVLVYMTAQKCVAVQSTQTKFFKVTVDEKKPAKFVDIYDCKDNIYVFMNQVNLTISYFTGQQVKTTKWKALGQGIATELARAQPGLKLVWNEKNIKAATAE